MYFNNSFLLHTVMSQRGGVNLLFGQFFPKTENEENLPGGGGGGASLAPPLDAPLTYIDLDPILWINQILIPSYYLEIT